MTRWPLPALIALAVAACASHVPTDAQLTTLLHSDGAPPRATAGIDGFAANCLRAWSGDAELMTGLASGLTADDGKSGCRRRIDGWIADAARNPDRLAFDDLVPVPVVRRIVALQKSGHGTPPPAADRVPPPALQRGAPAPAPASAPPVDLGPTGQHLVAAENACKRLQAAADGGSADINVKRYARMCAPNLVTLRATMSETARTHPERLSNYARSADDIANAAQRFLDKAGIH